MTDLKILVPYPNSFGAISNTSLIIRSILPTLKSKTNVQIIWVVYQPDKIIYDQQIEGDIVTIDLHNYKNAIDLLKKIKPDIIYAAPYPEFIHYAFSLAGKFLQIPVVNLLYYDLSAGNPPPQKKLVVSTVKRVFNDSVPTEEANKKTLFRRGKYILYKFFFFLRTLFATQSNMLKSVWTVLTLIQFPLKRKWDLDPKYSITRLYLQNKMIFQKLLDLGFEKSTLYVTGNPMYDEYFQISSKTQYGENRSKKIRIMLAPDPLFEHGIWTKEQRNEILCKIINEIIAKKDNFSLIIKIHPSAANLEDYKEIVHSIDESIPVFQKGGIQNYLEQIDVVISYSAQSTGLVYSVLSNKPIIICNFFDEPIEGFIDRSLILECRSVNTLIQKIHDAIHDNPISETKRNKYIENFLFKADGKASERICNDLLNLTKNQ